MTDQGMDNRSLNVRAFVVPEPARCVTRLMMMTTTTTMMMPQRKTSLKSKSKHCDRDRDCVSIHMDQKAKACEAHRKS